MNNYILILGDLLVFVGITLIGFTSHGEANIFALPRMAAVFFPLTISWFLLTPWLGLFQKEIITNPRQLWRPALGALFAAPLATIVRGLLLNAPVIPILAIVLATTSALGMVIWRALYSLGARKSS